MVGTILAVGSAIASVAGGIMKSAQTRRANRIAQAENDRLDSENRAYYLRNYYADATQRADNQATITKAREILLKNNQAASGKSAVMGGTNATAAATKEVNNQVMADAVANVAANNENYRTHVEDSYRQQNQNIRNRNAQLAQNRATASNAAIDGAVNGMNTLATAFLANEGSSDGGSDTTTDGAYNTSKNGNLFKGDSKWIKNEAADVAKSQFKTDSFNNANQTTTDIRNAMRERTSKWGSLFN